MTTPSDLPSYVGYRFPPEIISYTVWLYFRFSLSYRDVEELLAARGVVLTYETVRQWCHTFGQHYANQLRRRCAQTGDKWHLDEVFLKINGKLYYLWRAVDQYGNLLDILVQSRRNKRAAKKFFRKLLKGCQYVPRVLITDKLAAMGQPKRNCCQRRSIGNTSASIIGPRIPINQVASVNEPCAASNQQVTLSASSLHTV